MPSSVADSLSSELSDETYTWAGSPSDSSPPAYSSSLTLNRDPEDRSPDPELETLERVVRAIVHGDTIMALDLMESGIPISGSVLIEQLHAPGSDLNKGMDGGSDNVLHFLLRATTDQFPDKVETVKFLLHSGMDPLVQGALGDTALHLLSGAPRLPEPLEETNQLALLKYLLRNDEEALRLPGPLASACTYAENVNLRNEYGNTPLSIAVLYGYQDCVKLLLETGADPDVRGEHDRKPLSWALERGNVRITNMLLDHGARFDQQILREACIAMMKRAVQDFCANWTTE
ncbi:ankyrin repeat-containing protein [Colletotrichum camelliae]|nr:ankyrin repeat-containing protein [Colletotrichum camelliae]